MKVKLLAMCLLSSIWSSAGAQDSIAISFSEEQDTLVKQRFIDRYENVFMTKVPTRHMLKADLVSSEMSGKGIYLGYEYKPLPFLSLEAGFFAQSNNFDPNRWDETVIFLLNDKSIWATGKLRWYYNMNRRIRAGMSANNFTGSYMGINYDHPLIVGSFDPNNKAGHSRLGLLFGYQGRFLQNGHFNFSAGLFNRQIGFNYLFGSSPVFFHPSSFVIGTQMSLGFALGDWKKRSRIDLCDVLVCDEQVKSHWKVLFPDISLGFKHQRVLAAIMFETQISKSPFSVQFQFESSFWNETNFGPNSRITLTPGIQLRSYFLRKRQVGRGLSGTGLSGLYTALETNYSRFDARGIIRRGPYQESIVRYHDKCEYLNTGIIVGYQQRLFGRLFIDLSYGYGWHLPVRQTVTIPSFTKGGNYPSAYDAFNLRTGIGLTL